jgi:YggT family protein
MIVLLLVTFVDLFVPLFSILIVVRAIGSFVARPDSRWYAGLVNLTEPLIAPVRRLVPATAGMDLAPLVVLLLLQGLQYLADGLVHP